MFNRKVIYVVGNKFENFSKHEGVFTFSDFVNLVCNNKNGVKCHLLVLGQGLTEEEKNILKAIVVHSDIGYIQEATKPLASRAISHKHKIENIMISNPERVDYDDVFVSHLYLNDDCAEMSDHTTGQHIQGMVFTEAARQMMLAVAEKFILKDNEKFNSYCALIKVSSQFYQFGFPIETRVVHEVEMLSNEKPGRYKASTTTSFLQNDKIIATVDIDYLYNNKKVLEEREALMAATVLEENRKLKLGNIPQLKVA
jgi:hypothetical protein